MVATNIIIALDSSSLDEELIYKLRPLTSWFKIGCHLLSKGLESAYRIKDLGCSLFLDVKANCLLESAKKLGQTLAQIPPDLVDIHLSLDDTTIKSFKSTFSSSKVIGVTILTSLPNRDDVLRMSERAYKLGLDGVVCSMSEVKRIKKNFGANFLTITPGIRPIGTRNDEQIQHATPIEAVMSGSDYLVIGRPITRSPNPLETLKSIIEEINGK